MELHCDGCQKSLISTHDLIDNALEIQFSGGYGMFVDPMTEEEHEKLRLIICHECAHELCRNVEYIREAITPESSHAHTADFWKENPHHFGWDKKYVK